MTENGIREGQFSCPVVNPGAGKGSYIDFIGLSPWKAVQFTRGCFLSGRSVLCGWHLSCCPSECHLPSQQRLSCGPDAVSQAQCLSMGCCFSKHSSACYYPMDGELQSVPTGIFTPLSRVQLLCFGNHWMCEEAFLGPAQRDSSEWHRMWKGYKIPWVSLSIASWDSWPFVHLTFT